MKLERVDIHNFRSINETKCIVSNQVTVLAGRNETGKTNILEAISLLNSLKEFKDQDKPKDRADLEPGIHFTFTIEKSDFEFIEKSIIESQPNFLTFFNSMSKAPTDIIVTRKFNSENRLFKGGYFDYYSKVYNSSLLMILDELNTFIESLKSKKIDNNIIEMLSVTKPIEEKRINVKIEYLNQLNDSAILSLSEIKSIKECFQDFKDIIRMFELLHEKTGIVIPKVVLFDSFEDILPHQISIKQLIETKPHTKVQRIVMDLIKLAGINISEIGNYDVQKLTSILRKASKISSEDFGSHWNQEDIEIDIDVKGDSFLIWIKDKDDDYTFKPNQRSKGLQWFLNFFLRLQSQGEDERKIILIDEPGSYLHPKAQDDVLKFLEKLSEKNQIIFTTHSPFLIDTKKLTNVRLVTKPDLEKGTKIENNFNANSDRDTLTPIITAIGLDLSKGIEFASKWNILLEGVSDYHYLQSILEYLQKTEKYEFPNDEIRFIPSIGHTQISHILSILHGWGLGYVVLLDKKGTNRTYKVMKKDGIDDDLIMFVSNKPNESIEDLFTKTDTDKYKIKDFENKKDSLSKSIISKQFAEDTNKQSFTLNKTTITNFRNIFDKIKQKINQLENQ